MYHEGQDVFYYVTLYNENYAQPKKPADVDEGIIRGLYRFAEAPDLGPKAHRARLVGSGSILQQVIAARDLLADQVGIAAEIYSAPSFPLLRREALETERFNRLTPSGTPRVPYVSTILGPDGGPIVAATDWLKALPDMVARWLPPYYVSLGTDGFGRSDTREALRSLFEIDPPHIAAAVLSELARCGAMPTDKASKAISTLGVDPKKLDPAAL
jgi:pyruvate dehydrogenase E1 component